MERARFVAFLALFAHFYVAATVTGPQPPATPFATIASAFALVGLGVWEHIYVVAGQEPPLS